MNKGDKKGELKNVTVGEDLSDEELQTLSNEQLKLVAEDLGIDTSKYTKPEMETKQHSYAIYGRLGYAPGGKWTKTITVATEEQMRKYTDELLAEVYIPPLEVKPVTTASHCEQGPVVVYHSRC